VYLQGLADDVFDGLAGEELRQRGVEPVEDLPLLVGVPRRAVGERPRRLYGV
jgi:hypothetical protein